MTKNYDSGPQVFVEIEVGIDDEKETFTIHEQVISKWSPFFRTAFQNDFVQGHTKTMSFDDIEPGIFGMMVNWLYMGEIVRGRNIPFQLLMAIKADTQLQETMSVSPTSTW